MRYKIGFDCCLTVDDNNTKLISCCGDVFVRANDNDHFRKTINLFMHDSNCVVLEENNIIVTTVPFEAIIPTVIRYLYASAIEYYKNEYIIIHGSCVIVNGESFVFIGSSRSGKTSTVFQMMCEKGGTYFADEVLLYSTKEHKLIQNSLTPLQLREPYIEFGKIATDAWLIGKLGIYSVKNENNKIEYNRGIKIDHIIKIKYYENCEETAIQLMTYSDAIMSMMKNIFNIHNVNISVIASIIKNAAGVYNCTYNGRVGTIIEYFMQKQSQ